MRRKPRLNDKDFNLQKKRKNKLKFYSKIPNYELKNSKYINYKPFTNFTNSTLNKNTLERLDEQEEKEHSKLSQGTFADERNNIVYSNNSLDEYNKESRCKFCVMIILLNYFIYFHFLTISRIFF